MSDLSLVGEQKRSKEGILAEYSKHAADAGNKHYQLKVISQQRDKQIKDLVAEIDTHHKKMDELSIEYKKLEEDEMAAKVAEQMKDLAPEVSPA